MANWFIGLPLATGVWFDALEPPPGVRKFGRDDVHITVAFLGAVSAESARRAFAARTFPLARRSVQLGEVEVFGRQSAFSALVQDHELELAIARERPWYLSAAGARPDERPPRAHATLARPQRRITPEQLRAAIAWARALQLDVRVELDRLALYTWSDDRAQSLFRIDALHALP